MTGYTLFGQKVHFSDAMVRYFDFKYLMDEKAKEAQLAFDEWHQEQGSFEAAVESYQELASKLLVEYAIIPAFDDYNKGGFNSTKLSDYAESCYLVCEQSEHPLERSSQLVLSELRRVSPSDGKKIYPLDKFKSFLFDPIKKDLTSVFAAGLFLANYSCKDLHQHNAKYCVVSSVNDAGEQVETRIEIPQEYYSEPDKDASMTAFNKAQRKRNDEEKKGLLIQSLEMWPLNEELISYIYIKHPEERSAIISIVQRFHEELCAD